MKVIQTREHVHGKRMEWRAKQGKGTDTLYTTRWQEEKKETIYATKFLSRVRMDADKSGF